MFIQHLFLYQLRNQGRMVYSHFTTATDTGNIQVVFQVVMDTIIRDNLTAAKLLWQNIPNTNGIYYARHCLAPSILFAHTEETALLQTFKSGNNTTFTAEAWQTFSSSCSGVVLMAFFSYSVYQVYTITELRFTRQKRSQIYVKTLCFMGIFNVSACFYYLSLIILIEILIWDK